MDELLRRSTDDGDVYYYQDALGSTIALTDENGNVFQRYKYDVYGAPTDADGNSIDSSDDNRFLFTGREYLAELGSYDYCNRTYSANVGRFSQIDSIRFRAQDSNLYRYVSNSPINFYDADGRQGLFPVGPTDQPHVPSPFDPVGFPYQIYDPADEHRPSANETAIKKCIYNLYMDFWYHMAAEPIFGPLAPLAPVGPL